MWNINITGCIDVNADNYDSNANVSDNSCVFDNISNPYIQVLINSDIPKMHILKEKIFLLNIVFSGNDDITVSYPASGNAIIRV